MRTFLEREGKRVACRLRRVLRVKVIIRLRISSGFEEKQVVILVHISKTDLTFIRQNFEISV